MFAFACSINLLKELREDQKRMLIDIPKNCEGPPCGECHLRPNELCDICGRRASARYFVSEYTDGPAARWNVIDRQTQEWVRRFASEQEASDYAAKLNAA